MELDGYCDDCSTGWRRKTGMMMNFVLKTRNDFEFDTRNYEFCIQNEEGF